MAWNYDPKQATPGLPDGDYEASIKDVFDGESKTSGNPMRTVVFTVYDKSTEVTIRDYFVEGNRFAMFRMKRLAQALGKAAEFEAGTFDLIRYKGANLTVVIITDEKGYNKIDEFKTLQRSTRVVQAALAGKAPAVGEEDIPFS